MFGLIIQKSAAFYEMILYMPVQNKLASTISQQICSNQLSRPQVTGYCVKESSLSSKVQTASVTHSPSSEVHFSLYTTQTQDLMLNLTYSVQDLPSFALFGLTSTIDLQNSVINVKIPQLLSNSSLICLACSLNANQTDFTFVASAQNISGLVLSPISTVIVNQSVLQFRLSGLNVGGLLLIADKTTIYLVNCKISGFFTGNVLGSFIGIVYLGVYFNAENVFVCVNAQYFGQGTVSLTGITTDKCDLCNAGKVAYGLCLEQFEHSYVKNGVLECSDTFEFDGEMCSCPEGDILNVTVCVNILSAVNKLILEEVRINSSIKDLTDRTKIMENLTINLTTSQDQAKIEIQNLYQLSNQSQNHIFNNYSILEQYIQNNFTILENNLKQNVTILDNRIFNNVSMINSSIQTLNISFNILNQNITSLNQTLIQQHDIATSLTQNITNMNQSLIDSNLIIQQQQLIIDDLTLQLSCMNNGIQGQQLISGVCRCPNGYSVIDNACQKDYSINISDSIMCSQYVYKAAFEMLTVTSTVTSPTNFSSGYVFASVIQNAFIDVSDNVYSSTVQPLFQSQNTFTNLKIQFGAQTFTGGQFILLSCTTIVIFQMNIVSKSGSQLTTASLLNIITPSTSNAQITNLLVNLSFATSAGNITLINNINGVFDVSGYQVLGSYVSTKTVAMIGLNINANMKLTKISFKPNSYNVGNESSYLLGNFDGSKTLTINNIALIIGTKQNFLLLGSITSGDSTQYKFGGIVAFVTGASAITINKVIVDSFQQFSTQYVHQSGFLVGYVQSTLCNVSIRNTCLQQNMTSTTIQFCYFGLIGWNIGNISLTDATVIFQVYGLDFWNFGILGVQESSSLSAEVKNLWASVCVSKSTSGSVSAIIGWNGAANCTIQNASVVGGNISSAGNVGVFVGYQESNVTIIGSLISGVNVSGANFIGGFVGRQELGLTIMSSNVSSLNITGADPVGGFVGFQQTDMKLSISDSLISESNVTGTGYIGGLVGWTQFNFFLTNSRIQLVRLKGTGAGLVIGVVVGKNDGTMIVSSSSSASNYIQDSIQNDCAVLLSSWSAAGC
ncbi:filamentous_hemagglutinin N-terminal domain-containing protein [Hexamita inflata]|uniref:Filamentous hemagglutinin N-terminal domain-containing protein n=1 Tax=Hexamita inflata TaxID=28002 RepID=A0AA86Q1H3_9EUKA|nr:filamentous hemagglutinin N-terminal domain-containing protein [Hexamita inflata]